MKFLKALFNAVDGVFRFVSALVLAGLIILFIAGQATLTCKTPSWINNNYSCQAFVNIPNYR